MWYLLVKTETCRHVETDKLVFIPNQMIGFYLLATLWFNELTSFWISLSMQNAHRDRKCAAHQTENIWIVSNCLSNKEHRYFIKKSIMDLALASFVNEMGILLLLYNPQAVNKPKEFVSKICTLNLILIPVL